jgi:hypothetical protein
LGCSDSDGTFVCGDDFVGQALLDGWWVKAPVLSTSAVEGGDGSGTDQQQRYYVVRGEGFDVQVIELSVEEILARRSPNFRV